MKTRSEIAEPINLILVLIKDLLAIHKEAPVVLSAFRALKAIAATLCSGEEGSMAELVPCVLSASKEKYSASAALGALAAMSYVCYIFCMKNLWLIRLKRKNWAPYHSLLQIHHLSQHNFHARGG